MSISQISFLSMYIESSEIYHVQTIKHTNTAFITKNQLKLTNMCIVLPINVKVNVNNVRDYETHS